MATTTKKQLIHRIADSTQTKRALVADVIQSFLDEIVSELDKGSRLEFRDFGVFETRTRPARTGLNPRTLGRIRVPIKGSVKFRAGRLMREKLNGGTPD